MERSGSGKTTGRANGSGMRKGSIEGKGVEVMVNVISSRAGMGTSLEGSVSFILPTLFPSLLVLFSPL